MRGLENRSAEQTRQTRKSPAHSRHEAELHTQKSDAVSHVARCCILTYRVSRPGR